MGAPHKAPPEAENAAQGRRRRDHARSGDDTFGDEGAQLERGGWRGFNSPSAGDARVFTGGSCWTTRVGVTRAVRAALMTKLMAEHETWPLLTSVLLFAASTLAIGIGGWKITAVVDRLADRTGLGEAVSGAVFLGASTSLSGIVTSVTTALGGHAEFAMSHGIGGIAIQTAFLAVADITYREANLEHAAASQTNLMNGVLLITLLALILLATRGEAWTVWSIHPITPVLFITYLFGMRLVHRAHMAPLWEPTRTAETRLDIPDEPQGGRPLSRLWVAFCILGLIVGTAGWLIGRASISIVAHTGLSETIMGGLFATLSTSLPELVAALAAVRRGALTLAVGGIIGGNTFDTLLLALSDVAYRKGSIYHAAADSLIFLVGLTTLLTTILLLGLLRREKHGFANIGFESLLVLLVYGAGIVFLFLAT